ncbi:hypothetical protein D3D02_16975 [Halobellus sp. Atlit-38R]|nr:hypothetical protein D3D02_16975 [Halobellus sp. Atlit-38R]
MGQVLKQTPEAALWTWALAFSCIFVGATYSIALFAPVKQHLVALVVAGVLALGCWVVMRTSEQLSDTLLGQYVWTVTVWLAAEDADERAAYIEQSTEGSVCLQCRKERDDHRSE